MARRHEDRKPGQRFARPGQTTNKKTGSKKAPARKAPTTPAPGKTASGISSTRVAKAPASRPTSKVAGKRPSSTPLRKAPAKRAPLRGSKRIADGLIVKPSTVFGEKESATKDGKVRLNHFLAQSGVCSRRNADDLIAGGRVTVNGEKVRELGVRVDPVDDEVVYDGKRLQPERGVYVLVNKPKNVVCTNAAYEKKKRVVDLLPTIRGRIFTVGRLDLDSEGLLLVTNDGSFAQEMTHPRYGITKLYSLVVRGRIKEEHLSKARGGVWLSEGPTSGMEIKIDRLAKERTFLKVTLREGKNREIRRVFAKLGYPVTSLKRVRIGHLTLHGLKEGAWRFLQADEVTRLRELAHQEQAAGGAAAPINAFAETPGQPASRRRVIRKTPVGRSGAGKPASRKPDGRGPLARKKISRTTKR